MLDESWIFGADRVLYHDDLSLHRSSQFDGINISWSFNAIMLIVD